VSVQAYHSDPADIHHGGGLLGLAIWHVTPLDQAGAAKISAPRAARARPARLENAGCEEKVMMCIHYCSSAIHAPPSHHQGGDFAEILCGG
jgi:hypothetical protein